MLCTVVRGSSDVPTQGGRRDARGKRLAPLFPLFWGERWCEAPKGACQAVNEQCWTSGKSVEPEDLEYPENLFKPVSGASGIVGS